MIKLGPISDISVPRLRKWRNDPRIYKWCRQYEPREQWGHQAWYDSLKSRDDIKMYGVYDDSAPVGVCGLTSIDLINRHAEFSLYIDPDFHGKGYGTAALKALIGHGFGVLGLEHIFGETFEENPAAKVFEKVGFIKEGTRRKFYYREGKFIDAHIYSMLASEWRTL